MIFYNEKFVEKKKMYFILKLLLYIKNIYIIIFKQKFKIFIIMLKV